MTGEPPKTPVPPKTKSMPPKMGPDDTWPAPSPSWLPRDGGTLPSLPSPPPDERMIELDSDNLEDLEEETEE